MTGIYQVSNYTPCQIGLVKGERGENGANGANGLNGKDGKDGKDGLRGLSGSDGKSNYQLALDAGFIGSLDDYLLSMKCDTTELSNKVNAVEVDLSKVKLDTGITATAKFGGSERQLSDRLADTVNIMDFGINALTDHTPAFIKAGLLAGSTVYIKEGEYNVKGTIPTNCIFEGQGKVVINLNVSGGNDLNADRGFWLQSGSGMKNVHIKRDVESPMISGMGDYNGAMCIGQYYDPNGVEYKDIVVEDVFLEGVDDGDAQAWSSIFPIAGNVSDVKIKNLKVRGYATFAVMMHWSGDFDWMRPHDSLVTKTYHPRRIEIDGLDIDLTTDIQKTYGIGGIFVSACHDITVNNLRVANCTRPVSVYAGDCGDLAATSDSKGKILKNIRFNDTTIINHKGLGVHCDGASLKRVNNTSWLSVANNSDVIFNNLSIERGELAGLDFSLFIDKMSGVTVNGLNIRQDAVYPIQNRPAIYVAASSGIKISGKTNTLNPWGIFGSRDVTINTNDTCIKPANDTANIGGRISGDRANTTLANAISIGDTEVTLATTPIDIIPDAYIKIADDIYVVTNAEHKDLTSPVTVKLSSPVVTAQAAGVAVTVDRSSADIKIFGSARGYYYGLNIPNSAQSLARNITVQRDFRGSYVYDVYAEGVRTLKVNGCNFLEGAQSGVGANIKVVDCRDVSIDENTFEHNITGLTNVDNNIYMDATVSAAKGSGNKFYNAKGDAIRSFKTTAFEMLNQFPNNWFGPKITVPYTISTNVRVSTIGGNQVAYGSGIPDYGRWKKGDIVFNDAPSIGSPVGWRCISSGDQGVWEVLVNVKSEASLSLADINHLEIYGQSLSQGATSYPIQTTSQKYDSLMFSGGLRVNHHSSGTKESFYDDFVPLVEADSLDSYVGGETPCGGAAQSFVQLMRDKYAGTDLTNKHQILASASGEGGMSIYNLKNVYMENSLKPTITAAVNLANAKGLTYDMPYLGWIQGTQDNNVGTLQAVYKAGLQEIMSSVNAHLGSLGESGRVKGMIVTQLCSFFSSNRTAPHIELALYDEAIRTGSNIYMAVPQYIFDYNDDFHVDGVSSKWMGAYIGFVYKKLLLDNVDWKPLHPISHVITGNSVVVKFHVPVKPLAIDTTQVALNTNYGFEMTYVGGTNLPVTSVELVGDDSIRITASATIPADAKIRYAWSPKAKPNRFTGPRGNIRDSQGNGVVFDPTGLNKPLHNWLPILSYSLTP